jgi:hypothetical protein
MFRSTFLAPSHYAGKWAVPAEDQRYDLAEVNVLAQAYALLPDSPEKEEKLIKLIEHFHGYLMKYLCMVVRGTIPNANSYAGRDAKAFLYTLKRKGVKFTKEVVDATCKMLHLAFKGDTTEEIYDSLVFCFVRAARQYDPHYASKTKEVCEVIPELQKQFTVADLEARVGFSCGRILASLSRKGLVKSVIGKKKVVGYTVGAAWPAPAKFFEIGSIGFVYVAQLWFRHYLNEHIIAQMDQLESNDGVLQLSDSASGARNNGGGSKNSDQSSYEVIQAHTDGNCVNVTGKFRFMADRVLIGSHLYRSGTLRTPLVRIMFDSYQHWPR